MNLIKYSENAILRKIGSISTNDDSVINAKFTCDINFKMLEFDETLETIYEKLKDNGFQIRRTMWVTTPHEIRTGIMHTELKVGESFFFRGERFSDHIKTSKVKKVIDDNLFITNNSVYFIETSEWRKKILRKKLIKNLLNDRS